MIGWPSSDRPFGAAARSVASSARSTALSVGVDLTYLVFCCELVELLRRPEPVAPFCF